MNPKSQYWLKIESMKNFDKLKNRFRTGIRDAHSS